MRLRIGCVVEGHGEVTSLPTLIRRLAHAIDPALAVEVPHPVCVTKSKLLKSYELERATQLAALNIANSGGIVILLDSDDDCPAELGPRLLARVRSARADLPSAVVLAKKEFEAWFLAAAVSLSGCHGLPTGLEPPDEPEEITGAKEWLAKRMRNRSYASTVDQTALTAQFDIRLARQAPSFDKCYRDISSMLRELRTRQ